MKNIHVLLLNYSNSITLRKALNSLNFIHHHVRDITVLKENNSSLKPDISTINQEIKYITLLQNDLGKTLNEYIQKLSYDYVLFLYNQDYLNANIKDVRLQLYDNQYVIAYPYTIKDKVIQRPFLIKTSFLKQTNFFLKYQTPFKEAILSAWLSRLKKSYIVNESGNFINQTIKDSTTSTLEKLNFIEKYQRDLEQGINTPSISVIISNYNMVKYVGTAISSCLLQNNPPEKILVIDDGSTDNSYKELERWREHPQFRLLKKENRGKARSLNDLLPYVETDFVVELDADDWFDPDAFSIIRKHLRTVLNDVAVLYGNLRTWKQTPSGGVKYKGVKKGKPIGNKSELLSYRFPLGPRIYRTSSLKKNNGFPITAYENGRMYEDVSILNALLKEHRLLYEDFTVYNVREHDLSITKKKQFNWNNFIKYLE
ncbi:glycosyltransferase family 2 protein [Priestia aryabhattai]|uniref:glycosyltransferase family 2 protein n=1 Tax=Priestia aryabhattai TaxID=412384 RepID=UPI002041A014|nr:glycosyltransferase family A protein [Priestia aryabhattai]MCM3774128.1 glycosyltransferase family 2 protein [Priestia aryabhattai]